MAGVSLSAQDPSFFAPFSAAGEAMLKNFFSAYGAQSDPGLSRQLQSTSVNADMLAALRKNYFEQHAVLWQSMLAREKGETPKPVVAHADDDRRFASTAWRESAWFDYLRQSYLINARFLLDSVEAMEVDAIVRQRLRFMARQFADAMSPANFAATNPEAIRLAQETKGESLALGVRLLIEDMHKGRISTTDESAFEVGRNLAVTEGAVVFENELIQLIQYSPRTATVFERPLLMIPPCINKFYILDLQQENSLVRHAVELGHTVFMISWRNVTEELGHLRWDDYLDKGVMQAIAVTRKIARVEKINALGFCVGGTMLGAALAVMAEKNEEFVESATFLASMLDFHDTGEIGLFVDETSVAAREAAIGSGGILPGRELALVFSALRANDLVWSYVVNNYLKGRPPEAFDILYWNADSTNLPGPMYCWYVRNMYLENNLPDPGALVMLGAPVDLGRVTQPAYMIATREDHIVPWRTAYRSTQLLKGPIRFALGASGHVAGIINPPEKKKRSFWSAETLPAMADDWLAQATETPGSWWTDWSAWLARFGGKRVKARSKLGSAAFKPVEPAPGRYVKQRIT